MRGWNRFQGMVATGQVLQWLAVLGCALRLWHYLRDPAMWHDEAALVLNVLHKDFVQLLGRLEWHEAAPPLFLWLERAVVLTLGDSTLALRLPPVLASCVSLVLFSMVVRRWLSPWAAFWAMLLFAASDRLSWHACEAKPYAVDVLLAVGLLSAFEWSRAWPAPRRLLIWSLASPIVIWLSYPGCFLCGALMLAEIPALYRERRFRAYGAFSIWALMVFIAFATLYFGPIRAQRSTAMEGCWTSHFPDWSRPSSVPVWMVASTLEVVRYCFYPWGMVLVPIVGLGVATRLRATDRIRLAIWLGPMALAFVAACLHGYPFGGSRVEAFCTPGLALVIGTGAAAIGEWCQQSARRRLLIGPVIATLLSPVAYSLFTVVVPWPRAATAEAARHVLQHLRPGDRIAGNHWEYAYYFRHHADQFDWLGEAAPHASPRVWVIVTAPDAKIRNSVLESNTIPNSIRERRDFTHTTVALTVRNPERLTAGP